MREFSYRVRYEKIASGEFQVFFPAIPEIITYGRTEAEAREMAKDALLCHLAGLEKSGERFPQDTLSDTPMVETVSVQSMPTKGLTFLALFAWEDELLHQLPIDLGGGLRVDDGASLLANSNLDELHPEESERKRFRHWKVCVIHEYESNWNFEFHSEESIRLLGFILAHLRLIVPNKTIFGNYLHGRLESHCLNLDGSSWTLETVRLEDCELMASIISSAHLRKLRSWVPWILKLKSEWSDYYPLYLCTRLSEQAYREEDPRIRHLLRVMALEALVSSDSVFGKRAVVPRMRKLLGENTDLYAHYRNDLQPDLGPLPLGPLLRDICTLRNTIGHGDRIRADWLARDKRVGQYTLSYADELREAATAMVSLAMKEIIENNLQDIFADKKRMEDYFSKRSAHPQ